MHQHDIKPCVAVLGGYGNSFTVGGVGQTPADYSAIVLTTLVSGISNVPADECQPAKHPHSDAQGRLYKRTSVMWP